MNHDSRAPSWDGRGPPDGLGPLPAAWSVAAVLFALCVVWGDALREEGAVEGGWRRLGETELQAMAARSYYVKLGATEVIYHVSPSGADVRVHYPSMAYRTRYRRKVEGASHCYHAAELPFTGWRCYSVWRKGDALREVPIG